MINALQRTALRRAVRRLVNAEVADAFKGAGDPRDHPAIVEELKHARKHLDRVLWLMSEKKR